MSTIGVNYNLYRKNGGVYDPVTSQSDLDLQTDLRDKDNSPVVEQEATVELQDDKIDDHVAGIYYETEVGGHLLEFPLHAESKWDQSTKNWIDPYEGGAVIYRVYPTGQNPSNSSLYLEVKTADA